MRDLAIRARLQPTFGTATLALFWIAWQWRRRASKSSASSSSSPSAPDGNPIDYREAVNGHLDLVPNGEARKTLADDYRHMVDDGLLLENAEDFDALLRHCQTIQNKANVAVPNVG